MIGVDPRFQSMGKAARRRRRRVRLRRWAGAIFVLSVAGFLGIRYFSADLGALLRFGDQRQELVQVESEFDIAPVVRTDTFTDIPGDPLIIPTPDDGEARDIREEPVPAALASGGRVPASSGAVAVLESELVPRNRQLVAALPSSREEFALFQAERSRARLMNASLSDAEPASSVVPADQRATSSIAFLRDSSLRSSLWREMVVETTRPTGIGDLLARNGFRDSNAEHLADRIRDQLSLDETLPGGALLAMRYRIRGDERQVIQLTLYGTEGFVGSLAMSQAGQLVPSADAWADQFLLERAMSREEQEDAAGQQRLLDLIYSAALRNDVPSQIIGEALAMMARVYDLDSYADESDRLTLIYAPETGTGGSGAILFIGVTGQAGERSCYVVPAEADSFECHAPGSRAQRRDDGLQMVSPVSGVLSQRFIPPTEGEPERGRVIWSTPTGSPVLAAGDGRITLASVDDRKGAQVEITHPNGMVTRYEGLGALSGAAAQGGDVARGTVIGMIGGTIEGRRDTGLIFRLLKDGQPVDPMPYLSSAGKVLASDAIEALIAQIIRVESAGNARAQNPRSTAAGLGQFIESTWIRMMRSYRPDLISSLSRTELLELRFNPEMSREMVRHLAQENEAYLRARGHSISAGRLYLAHFLGPAGADQALRAESSLSVASVMGAGVVVANPFLRGYSIGDLRNWADRKMSGSPGSEDAAMPPEPPLSPELRAYVSAMDRLRGRENG